MFSYQHQSIWKSWGSGGISEHSTGSIRPKPTVFDKGGLVWSPSTPVRSPALKALSMRGLCAGVALWLCSLMSLELSGHVILVLSNHLLQRGGILNTGLQRVQRTLSLTGNSGFVGKSLLSNSSDLKKRQNLQPSSLQRSSYPILFLSVPHTRTKTVAMKLFLPQEGQQKAGAALESAEESWHLTCGTRLAPSPEILFSAACFPTWSWRSVRTWHRMQKENCPLLGLLLDSRAQPQGCRGTPLAEAEMPNSLVLAESTGVQTFRKRSPPPRHISYMIWRSRPMQKADVWINGPSK